MTIPYDKTIGIDYENEKFTNIIDGDYTITGEDLEKSLPAGSNSAIAIDNSYFVGDITISGTGDGNVISQTLTLTRPAAPIVTTDYTVTQPETANEKGTVTAQNGANLQYSTDGSEWTDVPEEIAQGTTFYLRKTATDSAFASTAASVIIDTIAQKFTVTFNTDGGSEIAAQEIEGGGKATRPPANPSKANYDFVDWYTTSDGTTVFDFSNTAITEPTTVFAHWTPKSYSITYYLNGHGTADNTTYTYGTAKALAAPTADGYTFGGWYTDEEFTEINKVESVTAETSGDLELYAKWTAIDYTITDNTANDAHGSLTIPTKTGLHIGDTVTITVSPDSDYVLDELTVNNEPVDVLNNTYEITMPAGNVTVEATFTQNVYTVTLNAGDGSFEGDEKTAAVKVNKGSKITSVTNPTSAENYEFTGWKLNGSGDLITDLTQEDITGNVTYVAQYVLVKHNVTYTAEDTSGNTVAVTGGDIADNKVEHGKAVTITVTPTTCKKVTKITVGNIEYTVDGDNKFTLDGDTATVISYTVNADTAVTADYSNKTYTITYNNTKTADTTGWTESYTVEDAVTLPANPTVDGFIFAGWYTDAELQNPASGIAAGTTGNKDFYAKWTVIVTPTATPTSTPTATPTSAPTATPTSAPTATPTSAPTATPTSAPTATPTSAPTATPTSAPTATPTSAPAATPTATPTATPKVEQKYLITFVNWDGEELQTSNVTVGTVPSYTGAIPSKEEDDEYTYIFAGWTPELAVVTGTASYTAQYTAVRKEAQKTFLDLLSSFNWLKIEKTNAADSDDVVLTVSKDQESQNDIPTLTAYIAVYNNGVLQSAKKHDFVSSAVTLPASEVTGEYKIFIWADQMEPVIEAVTPNTTGANKLFE